MAFLGVILADLIKLFDYHPFSIFESQFPWFILPGLFEIGRSIIGGEQQKVREKEERKLMQASSLQDIATLQIQTDKYLTDIQEKGAAFKHEQKAMIGASGVKLTSGSPLAMLQKTDTGIQRDIDNLMDTYVGNVKKYLLESGLATKDWLDKIKRGGEGTNIADVRPPFTVEHTLFGDVVKPSKTDDKEINDFIKFLKKQGYLK